MIPAMLFINVSVRCSSSTSAFNYFWLSLNNLFLLIDDRLVLDKPTIIWFISLAVFLVIKHCNKVIGGSVVTMLGYSIMKAYKTSYMIVFIVVMLDVLNVTSGNIYFFILKSRFGL